MPLVRIRRMGNQFLSCGITIRPPKHMINKPGIKRLCPKLVPGQVIELPEDHNALNQDCIEIVKKVRDDEVLRPWVFESAEDAAMANPAKSRHSIEEIVSGLALAEGAINNADEHREKARAKAKRKADAEDEDTYDDDDERIDDSDAANARRASNRQPGEVYDDATPAVIKEEPSASVRRRRARARQ